MAYSNPAARIGEGTNNLAQQGEHPLTRISNDYMLLLSLYRCSWICRKVVDVMAEDMLKDMPTLKSQEDPEKIDKFNRALKRTNTQSKLLEALKWGRLFGGGVGVICIEGVKDLAEPLDYEEILPGKYKGLIPLDRWSGVYPGPNLVDDVNNPTDFGLPEYYMCYLGQHGSNIQIHHTRLVRFIGRDLPNWEKQVQLYWGMSELELVFDELRKRDYASWNIVSLISRANIMTLVEPELAQLISGAAITTKAYQKFVERMKAIADSMNNQGLLVLGKDGNLQSNSYSFGGLDAIYEMNMLDLAGACETPVSRLYGRSITGLGQSGEGDLQVYYDTIDQKRTRELGPQIEKLYKVIAMSEWGEIPADLDYEFPPTRTLADKDRSELAKANGDAVLAAYNTGIIGRKTSLKELRQQSTVTGLFTNITDKMIDAADDEPQPTGEGGTVESLGSGLGAEKAEKEELGEEGELKPSPAVENKAEKDNASSGKLKPTPRTFAGVPVAVGHPKGARRLITNDAGESVYDRMMKNDYGCIRNTVGRDGDEIDVILGPNENSKRAFVVDMRDLGPDKNKRSDEDKYFIGFNTRKEAFDAFLHMHPPSFFGGIKEVDLNELRRSALKPLARGELIRVPSREAGNDADFEENKHPRDEDGKFSSGGSSASAHLQPAFSNRADWPEHVKKLKLPPAWKDVQYSNDPDAALQATGKDSKGRSQHVYLKKFSDSQSAMKFARIKELDAKFDKIRKQNADRIATGDESTRENAQCAALVMEMGIRPGSDRDAKAKVKAYGATTLEGRHVVEHDGEVYLMFTGKKGVNITLPVNDSSLKEALLERKRKSGDNGKLFPGVTDKSLLEYTQALNGGSFKTKDFRTLRGTREAVAEAEKIAPPKDMKDYKKKVTEVAKRVSMKLGNTPVVALQSYINPAVFAPWRALIEDTAQTSAELMT